MSHPANFWLLGDSRAETAMRMVHHMQHRTYDLALSVKGISLGALDLTHKVNKDWLFRHQERHKALQQIVGGQGTCDLASLDWNDAQAVKAWMHYHSILHSQLAQALGTPT